MLIENHIHTVKTHTSKLYFYWYWRHSICT